MADQAPEIPAADVLDIATADQFPEHYIEAQTSLVERSLRTLKHGDAFAVTDCYGDIGTVKDVPEGLFFRDTRYLSSFQILIDGKRPLLLGSVIQDDNASLSVDLTNPDLNRGGEVAIPRDLIAIDRTKLLLNGCCHERIGLRSFDAHATRTFRLSIGFDADFRDLFEVRGTRRTRRGQRSERLVGAGRVELTYIGLDEIERHTAIDFEPAPSQLSDRLAVFDVTLGPGERHSIVVTVTCSEGECPKAPNFVAAYRDARRDLRTTTQGIATVESTNEVFNELMCRSTSDIYMLVSKTPEGLYPYAGTPWFSTVFGRDGIITAMMMLWVDPNIAKGVLRFLAASQATTTDEAADAEPGKILHERRHGEMANLGEVPFRRYYGTVDATPLFVMLAGMYFERTGDRATITAIWPNILSALHWCDEYGDRDRDGFVEYYRKTESGLANQGWKDSQDSIFHADGSDATGPIALCEVQGYVYAAKHAAAELAAVLGHDELSLKLAGEAQTLRDRFHEVFWLEDLGTYALALDGAKAPCRVRSSNAGHALFTGIADEDSARRTARTLLGPEGFNGWGIRTIAEGEPRFNPMSYHNGSVWPHDNGLIALGLARYGLKQGAERVFSGLYDAARYQDLRRLPELFCGFLRRPKRGPTAYPVACAPQAWAAATPFALLAACLGLELRYDRKEIHFMDPMLPRFMDDVTVRGIRLDGGHADVQFRRVNNDVTLNVLSREGDVRVVVTK